MAQISNEEFRLLVLRYFDFLINEHSYIYKEIGERKCTLESPLTKISIFIEYTTVVVGIEPIGEEAKKLLRENILPEQLSIIVVSKCLNPGVDYKIIWDNPIDIELERRSKLLKEYCPDFVSDDFSKWISVIECLKKVR